MKMKEEVKKAVAKKGAAPAAKAETKAVAKPAAKAAEKKAPTKTESKKPEPVKKEAAKKEATKVSPEKTEIPKIVEVPDACDAVADGFKTKGKVGFYDENSADCKQCGEDYPDAMDACKKNTEIEASQVKAKKTKTKKEGAPKGERTPLGGLISSGAGKNELLLLSKEGASMEEMAKNRGAVSSHIADLKKKGFKIELKDGRYYAKV